MAYEVWESARLALQKTTSVVQRCANECRTPTCLKRAKLESTDHAESSRISLKEPFLLSNLNDISGYRKSRTHRLTVLVTGHYDVVQIGGQEQLMSYGANTTIFSYDIPKAEDIHVVDSWHYDYHASENTGDIRPHPLFHAQRGTTPCITELLDEANSWTNGYRPFSDKSFDASQVAKKYRAASRIRIPTPKLDVFGALAQVLTDLVLDIHNLDDTKKNMSLLREALANGPLKLLDRPTGVNQENSAWGACISDWFHSW